jgi:hypothetical protein
MVVKQAIDDYLNDSQAGYASQSFDLFHLLDQSAPLIDAVGRRQAPQG